VELVGDGYDVEDDMGRRRDAIVVQSQRGLRT
jgi:hypothetical protein